jgi:hypothetical protein
MIVEEISALSRRIFDDHEVGGRATDPVNVCGHRTSSSSLLNVTACATVWVSSLPPADRTMANARIEGFHG